MLLFVEIYFFHFSKSFLKIPFENGLNSHFAINGQKINRMRYNT